MRHYTITTEDVGTKLLAAFGKLWPVQGFLGRILPGDVGKRVYLRAGVLQVENDEQRVARMSGGSTQRFEDDVAWLQFIADWERRDGWLHTPDRDKRMMRIGFDWAREHPRSSEPGPESEQPWCECKIEDVVSNHHCQHRATMHLFRVTGMVHETPLHDDELTVFCEPCGDMALESGTFCVGDPDSLEPNHGPGCVARMYCDLCNSADDVRPEPLESTYSKLCVACRTGGGGQP